MALDLAPEVGMMTDRIAGMLENRTILITGASGYLGKALLEKILRRCNVKIVYLLIRNKNGKTPSERIQDIFNNPLFDTLRDHSPQAFKKCKPIKGDVTQIDLGISPEDRKLLEESVEFVFHSAATTKFDETLRSATRINVRGTKYMLDLAEDCKKLKVFVHVSTAYSHPNQPILKEDVYKPPVDPVDVLSLVDDNTKSNEENEEHLKLLGDYPNTYTFTKAIAEDLVARRMEVLPIIIIRPSIVCPIWREPLPGWCDSMQGAVALLVAGGKGVMRSMHGQGHYHADFIPVDLVVNGILASSWNYISFDKSQRVYNVTSANISPVTWERVINFGKSVATNDIPFNGVVWYPGGSFKKSKIVHMIYFYLFQLLPAILVDTLLTILGYKPVLYQVQRRIEKANDMLSYFTTKEWEFINDKTMGIMELMNEKEAEIYKLDLGGIDLLNYFRKSILGIRRYNLKEMDDTLPTARRNIKIMWALDRVYKTTFLMVAIYYLYKWILSPIFQF